MKFILILYNIDKLKINMKMLKYEKKQPWWK